MISLGNLKSQMKALTKPTWSIDKMPDLEGKVVLVTGGGSGMYTFVSAYTGRLTFGRRGERYMQATSLEER